MKNLESWIQTYKGLKIWPTDPHISSLDIEDIAHALSNICRFNGHCKKFYSVAEHSILIALCASPAAALLALLHDAAEAYLTDFPSPIKQYFPEYKTMEEKLLGLIFHRFGVTTSQLAYYYDEVKKLDLAILATEVEQLIGGECVGEWYLPEIPLDIDIECWKPEIAKSTFLRYFTNYGGIW